MIDFKEHSTKIFKTHLRQDPKMALCQADYPLDWYQEDFIPYAEEYLALPDRKISTIVPWMRRYIEPAMDHFGDSLMLLAHYYMGGEIVKLVELFDGSIGDSYQLSLMASQQPEKKIIVESAVHFMAESISIMANDDQQVYITNPKSGCTMELMAKDYMVEPAIEDLNERYGKDNILPICYMNTSGRVKALTGAQGGAVCTSSNVEKIFRWALEQNKKILFIPDQLMGENVAMWLGIPPTEIAYWPGGTAGAQYSLFDQDQKTLESFDKSKLVLFSSYCAVHRYFSEAMVTYWQDKNYHVIAHPECHHSVISKSDSYGSTAFIWDQVTNDKAKTKRYAIATENHMVENVKQYCQTFGIDVVNVADASLENNPTMGCGCATMSRNDPPHLVAMLDLLRQGRAPEFNRVLPGDVVDENSGVRRRLDAAQQQWVSENAKKALENMIRITES